MLFIAIIPLFSCVEQNNQSVQTPTNSDPLPSWNQTQSKRNIIEFIHVVTNEKSSDYVPVEERIAVFDNDGTLWSEQPVYFQLFFAIDRLKSMQNELELKEESPLNALLEDDMKSFSESGMKGLIELVMTTHSGMSTDEFENLVGQWIDTARHPHSGKLYTELIYQPMLELLDYLRQHEFKTFIVSGGGIEFMRPWVEKTYGIPRDQVVGSSIKTEWVNEDGNVWIKRLPELDFIDDKEGKPLAINRFIGRKPIFCAGNSDGDLQMMQWTASGNSKYMNLYIHHTDSAREYTYDRNSMVGRFDKALDEANQKKWTIVSMKDDWKSIYP